MLIVNLSGTLPVERERLQILERGAARRSVYALMTLTLIPSIPSLYLVLSLETVLIILSGEVAEIKELLK